MVNVVDVALVNYRVFMRQHAHDAKVALTRYKRANGIPSHFGSDTNIL
jgi:hypothetical protein